MAGAKDRAKGKMNETLGKAKQAAGKATGNRRLEAEGMADRGKGKAQGFLGKIKSALKARH